MSSPPPSKKARTAKDAPAVAVVSSSACHGIHFTPELIARVASFAAISNADVMNICLAVGRKTSRTVKHYYLKGNRNYLRETLEMFASGLRRAASNTGGAGGDRSLSQAREKHIAKAQQNHLDWMSFNTNWKSHVTDELMEDLKLATKRTGCTIHPFMAFNNPAVAIQLGLDDVLKHLVEVKSIDINALQWTAYNFSNDSPAPRSYRLLACAVGCGGFQMRLSIFTYLLGRNDIDFRCKARDRGSLSLFDCVISSPCALRHLIDHPNFDANGPMVPSASGVLMSPLFSATVIFLGLVSRDEFNASRVDRILAVLRILIEAGADPELADPAFNKTPLELVRMRRAKLARDDRESYWNEAVRLLERR